jgi:hypothetical protein
MDKYSPQFRHSKALEKEREELAGSVRLRCLDESMMRSDVMPSFAKP